MKFVIRLSVFHAMFHDVSTLYRHGLEDIKRVADLLRKSFGLQSIRAQNTGADAPKWLIFGGKATELRFQLCSTGSPVSLTLSIPTLVLS